MFKRTLSSILAFAMILSMCPIRVAAETVEDPTVIVSESAPETSAAATTVAETSTPETTVEETTLPETTAAETTAPTEVPTEEPTEEPAEAVTQNEAENDTDVSIDETNFPDANFRTYVLENLDADNDGYLNLEEQYAVTDIDVSYSDIGSVEGIAFFPNLSQLYCNESNLTELDVSSNTALITLDCSYTGLTSLDVSNNTALEFLHCGNTGLTSLDVSSNTALTNLWCDWSSLLSLDVSSNTALTELNCSGNDITELDIRSNTALINLFVNECKLTELDVRNNSALECFYFHGNQLTSLDLSNKNDLSTVNSNGNQYTITLAEDNTFDLSTLPGNFDVAKASNWVGGTVEGTVLTAESETVTYTYDMGSGYIETFTLATTGGTEPSEPTEPAETAPSETVPAETAPSEPAPVIAIDATNFPDSNFRNYVRWYLDADEDGYLNLEEQYAVTAMDVSYSDIHSLEGIQNFPELRTLHCQHNALTSLDISANTKLTLLDCNYNQLTSLDLGSNTALECLYSDNNQLTQLDVSSNTSLWDLSCSDNKLTELDLSNNPHLNYLYFDGNQLTSMNLGNMSDLWTLHSHSNRYTITTAEDYTFDLSTLPGSFDVTKASKWSGGTVEGNILTVTAGTLDVTYTYDMGNGHTARFALVPPHKHGYTQQLATNTDLVSPATCTESAVYYYRCLCGEQGTETFVYGEPLGHIWTEASPVAPMTCQRCSLTEGEPLDPSQTEGWVAIDETNFPDASFRNYVNRFDKGGNGYLSPQELATATDLTVYDSSITSLEGIEHFKNLKTLGVGMSGTELDLSKNTALERLKCSDNRLTSLNVSGCTALTYLDCSYNQLTSLDLSNNPALTTLYCYNNQLTSLDVSNNPALTALYCYNNQLTSLDVSNNPALCILDCGYNQLTTLDVTSNTALENLYCGGNQLTSLDLSNCVVWDWGFYKNRYAITPAEDNTFDLTTLPGSFDIAKASNWVGGTVEGNILTVTDGVDEVTYTYDLGNGYTATFSLVPPHKHRFDKQLATDTDLKTPATCTESAVYYYSCRCGQPGTETFVHGDPLGHDWAEPSPVAPKTCLRCALTEGEPLDPSQTEGWVAIDESNFPDAGFRNYANRFDTGKNGYLSPQELATATDLYVYDTNITSLEGIEHFENLKYLSVRIGGTELDLSKNTALERLYCDYSKLTSLNVSGCTALTSLSCYGNKLTSLDLSSNTALTYLNCGGNKLTSLDLSSNPALTSLYCYNNRITTLDLSNNPALTRLSCYSNQLTNLDISNLTQLRYLYSYSNAYSITVAADNTFDLSTLPGNFDVTKASYWSGGTVSGNILTVDNPKEPVTYTYDLGNGNSETFSLVPPHEHNFTQQLATDTDLKSPATCTEPATFYTRCDCGENGTETFTFGKPLGHDLVEASCAEPRHCSRCDLTEGQPLGHTGGTASCTQQAICSTCQTPYGDLLPHSFDQEVTDIQYLKTSLTCTTPTTYYKSCVCGEKGTETFTVGEPTGHRGGTASCTQQAVCDVCMTAYGDLLPHSFTKDVVDAKYLKSAATCTASAVYYKSCVCGEKGSDTFTSGTPLGHTGGTASCTQKAICTTCKTAYGDLLPHSFTKDVVDYKYLKSAATCTASAVYFKSCVCGEKGSDTFISGNPLGHSGGTASCTQKAICATCKTAYGDLLPHSYTKTVADAKYLKSAATCTASAVYYKSCVCGEKGSETFTSGNPLGHSGGTASCTQKAICATCKTAYGDLLPHSYTKDVVDAKYLKSAATCTASAVYYKSCVCGEKGTATFTSGNPKGHTWAAATCTSPKTCSVCKTTEGSALGHTWTAATCTTPKTCSVCKITEGTALAHTYSKEVADAKYLKSAATCTDSAVYFKSCVCGEKGTATFTSGSPKGHTGGTASCTQKAICTTCKAAYGDLKDHSYTKDVVDAKYLKSEATCTKAAVYYKSCVCGEKGTKTFTSGKANGHSFGKWIEKKAPTTANAGTERRDCKNCDHYETREIPKLTLDAPTLKVSSRDSDGSPSLSWNKVNGADSYQVYRATKKTGTYKRLITTTKTSYYDTKAETGTTYYYKVRAILEDDVKTNYSTIISQTSKLARPTVTLKGIDSTGKTKITWNTVEGAEKYEVYRATSKNGTYKRQTTTTKTYATHTSGNPGTTYYYKVRAIHEDTDANSAFSTVKSRTCDLEQPTIELSVSSSTGKIKVSWEAIEEADGYDVYRAETKNGAYTRIGSTDEVSYTDSQAAAGKTYYYKVKATHEKDAADSAFSDAESELCKLQRPSITMSNVASSGKNKVSWKAVEDAEKYEVYRATSKNGTYKRLITTRKTSYTDTSAEAGKTYYYRVKAIHENSAANSANSTYKSRTCCLARPDVEITLTKGGSPKLTWDKVDGAEKYQIYRATSKNGTYKLMKTTTSTSYTNTSAKEGTTYYYKVKAIHSKSAANSAYSTVRSIKAK